MAMFRDSEWDNVEHRTRQWYLDRIRDELGIDRDKSTVALKDLRVIYEFVTGDVA